MLIGKVWTPQGITEGPIRGLVGKGEVLYDYETKQSQRVNQGIKGKDTIPTNIGQGGLYDNGYSSNLEQYDNRTAIAGNNIDITNGISFADQASAIDAQRKIFSGAIDKSIQKIQKGYKLDSLARRTEQFVKKQGDAVDSQFAGAIESVLERQKEQRSTQEQQEGVPQFKGGSDSLSTFSRLFPTIAGLGAGIGQLLHWGQSPIKYHSTYAQNPYSTKALSELNNLRYNPYLEIQASLDAERRAAYANNQAGGMTGGQRQLGRIALGIGGMRNAASVYANAQQQNNALRSQYANALLTEGNNIASRRQNANQHDWADYVAAHGAKTRGIEQATANILNSINSGYQNEFKYRTWQDTLDLYRDQSKIDREKLAADIENAKQTRKALSNRYANYTQFMPTAYSPINLNRQFTFDTDLSLWGNWKDKYPQMYGNTLLTNNWRIKR